MPPQPLDGKTLGGPLPAADAIRESISRKDADNRHDHDAKRGEDAWDDFIKIHAAKLWSCDFFTKQVWTLRGLVEVYVLLFLNVETRRVYIAWLTAFFSGTASGPENVRPQPVATLLMSGLLLAVPAQRPPEAKRPPPPSPP